MRESHFTVGGLPFFGPTAFFREGLVYTNREQGIENLATHRGSLLRQFRRLEKTLLGG